jgi:signal peptidase II
VFNLADAFISVGAALVILQEILDWRSSRTEPKPD